MRCLSSMHAALDLPALRGHQIHAVRAASRYVHKNEVLSLLLILDALRWRFPLRNDERPCKKKYKAAVCECQQIKRAAHCENLLIAQTISAIWQTLANGAEIR